MAPTNSKCNVTATIDCKTANGVECDQLTFPDGTCSVGEGQLDVLKFRYVPCTCDESQNKQSGVVTCTDLEPINPDVDVIVTCSNGEGTSMTVDPIVVPSGETFTVTNPTGESLPSIVYCEISAPAGVFVQETSIATAVTLNPKDKFGSFTLEACDEVTCIEELCYVYNISNIGSSDMDITKIERYYNGEVIDMLPFITENPLKPGDTVSVEEKVTVDICRELTSCVDVDVEADPENGEDCQANATHKFQISTPAPSPAPTASPTDSPTFRPTSSPTSFPTETPTGRRTLRPTLSPTASPTNEQCNVTTSIDCKTTSGINCDELSRPVGTCADGTTIDVITFQYLPCTCDESRNGQDGPVPTCFDRSSFDLENSARMSCTDAGGEQLVVEPSIVPQNLTFTVTSPSGNPLPDFINCAITSLDGILVQENIIDTSGSVTLNLNDKFGGLTVKSCDELTCFERLCYLYSFSNDGTSDMEITVVERYFNGVIGDLLPFVPTNPLAPGDTALIEEKTTIDLCEERTYCVDLDVEASPENGEGCQSNGTYKFEIVAPPTPRPTLPPLEPILPPSSAPTSPCTIEFNSTCIPPAGADDCRAIPPAVQQCEGRPLKMGMLYNGGDCSQSFNIQEEDKFTCEDIGNGPPTIDGEQSYIVVIAKKDPDIVYHSDWVEVGSMYYLSDNDERFEADQNITIYSSDVLTPANTLQKVLYHSSCSQNLFLKDRFGASQLVEWFNEEQGLISCFANATFDLVVTIPLDIRGDSITLASLISITSWGVFNLTDEVFGLTLSPGDSVEASFSVTLDLTTRQQYSLLTEIIGTTDTGAECRGVDFYAFVAGNPLPPGVPTVTPTLEPTTSLPPTPDPLTTACSLVAEIRCSVANNVIQEAGLKACLELSPPEFSVCDTGGRAEQLRFLYSPRPCDGSNTTTKEFKCRNENGGPTTSDATIKFQGDKKDDPILFNAKVGPGEVIIIDNAPNGGELPDKIKIDITNDSGTRVQSMEYMTKCDDKNDISLLTFYGSLQLTAFENTELGYQSAIEYVEESFVARNAGLLPAFLEWTNSSSTQFGDNEGLVAPPGTELAARGEISFQFGPAPINLYQSNGQTFTSRLSVSGSGAASGLDCQDSDGFEFTVGGRR